MANTDSQYDYINETKMQKCHRGQTSIDQGTYETLKRNKSETKCCRCGTKTKMVVVGIISALIAATLAVIITILVSSRVSNDEFEAKDVIEGVTTDRKTTKGKTNVMLHVSFTSLVQINIS